MKRPFGIAIALAAVCLVCLGCGSSLRYVVLSDVPENPTVTVIPASTSDKDAEAALHTTELLVACGIHVVERPALVRQRSNYEGRTSGGGVGVTSTGQLAILGGGGAQQGELTISVDPVALIEETDAAYVIFVKPGLWLKVVRRSDKQILYVGKLTDDSNRACCLTAVFWEVTFALKSNRDKMRDLMRKLDILQKQ